jgi:NhaA family Na+:H+ antiporter
MGSGLMFVSGLAIMAFLCLVAKRSEYRFAGHITLLQEWGIFLLSGVVIAQVWANVDNHSYHHTIHDVLLSVGGINISIHFIINEILMPFYFGIAAKELAEARRPGGSLYGASAISPFAAAVGGMMVPAGIYALFCLVSPNPQWSGVAVPCATDIALGILVYEFASAGWHPKTKEFGKVFLLALAIADDFLGMLIIAIFYSEEGVAGFLTLHVWGWLIFGLGGAIVLGLTMKKLSSRHATFMHWWPYLLPGAMAWLALHEAGLHPSLSLVPIVMFCMPMQGRDEGIFADGESERKRDTVNRFEHAVKSPVEIFLLFFGLANAGVPWIGGEAKWTMFSTAVVVGLLVGKTIGIPLTTLLVARLRGISGEYSLVAASLDLGSTILLSPVLLVVWGLRCRFSWSLPARISLNSSLGHWRASEHFPLPKS